MKNSKKYITLIVIVTFIILFTATLTLSETLFGVTFGPTDQTSRLILINTSSGAGTLIGTLSDSIPSDIASNGEALFIFDQANNLLKQIDPSTAATIKSFNIGVQILAEGGMAFSSDGIGFICEGSLGGLANFYSFDITTSTSRFLGKIDASDIDGIAFDQNDLLYGLSDYLFLIDQSNGRTTEIGPTGVTKTLGLGGLAFRSDGVLFGVIDDRLYIIDKSNGTARQIGPIGFSNVSGIAFLSQPGEVRLPNNIQWKAMAILLDGIDKKEKYSIPVKEAIDFIKSHSRFEITFSSKAFDNPHTYTYYDCSAGQRQCVVVLKLDVNPSIWEWVPTRDFYMLLWNTSGHTPLQAGSAMGVADGVFKGGLYRPYVSIPVDPWWYNNTPFEGFRSRAAQIMTHEMINAINAKLEVEPYNCSPLVADPGITNASEYEASRLSKLTVDCYLKYLESNR